MKIYFAPLEGLTDSIYRKLHQKYFPGIHKYYTPFFSPTMHRTLTHREERELPPADTNLTHVVPQVLTKNADDFLWFASVATELGYSEVNLNLGCPSGTVFSKGKGSGMLTDLSNLERFLDTIFATSPIPISIKTRLGVSAPEEFSEILNIYNQYPISELILHPRVRNQFYKGNPDMEAFAYCLQKSAAPVCYNGNLCTLSDIDSLSDTYSDCGAVMLGRGLIADPGLCSPGGTTRKSLATFYEELADCYVSAFGSEKNALFRLKENWFYLLSKFENTDTLGKRLRKTTDFAEYKDITREIFDSLPMRDSILSHW